MSFVIDRILYTAEATVEGGREGHARTSDGRLDVDLDVPSEMGGAGGPGTNPEQLFAAGYAACFQSSMARFAAGGEPPFDRAPGAPPGGPRPPRGGGPAGPTAAPAPPPRTGPGKGVEGV